MQGKWGYSKEQIGMIVSSFSLAYGIGKFLAGNLVDRLNPKLLLLNGLFASGILMLSFPLVPNWIFSVFVAISFGLLGGSGWPGCAKLLILWYKPEEKGLRYSTVSMSGNVAAAIIPVVLSRATQWGYPWWYSFFALGCTSIVTAGVSYKTISLPEKPATEVYSNEKVASKVSYYDILLCNNTLWCLCGFGTLLSITRYTVISWNQLYFTEHAGIPLESAVLAMTWYQVGGVMGCFLCGASTDWFIRKNLYLKNSPRAAGLGVFTLPFAFCFLLYATTIHSGISQVCSCDINAGLFIGIVWSQAHVFTLPS
jgi:sugar phosphate permease